MQIYNPNQIETSTCRPNPLVSVTCFNCGTWFMCDTGITGFGQHYDHKLKCHACGQEIGIRD